MKNKILSTVVLLSAVAGMSSCTFLEVEPLDSYSESSIFTDAKMVETYVNSNYSRLSNITLFYNNNNTSRTYISDEAMNNHNHAQAWTLNLGGLTPDQCGGFSEWWLYKDIKNCNVFFENIDKLVGNDDMKNRMTGEMLFLRCQFYHELMRNYGGVPWITKTFDLDGNMMVPRESYETCVTNIVADLDKAANLLPLRQTGKNFGRATKGAALALKARVLLYAASPYWNKSNDQATWQAAANACKAVFDLGLYTLDSDFERMFCNPQSSEHIFQRLYNTEFSNWYDWELVPQSYGGYSTAAPLQGLIDAFEYTDGTMPTDANYAPNSKPWDNRDPRFYATITYNGAPLHGVDADFGYYIEGGNSFGGKDSRSPEVAGSWNGSRTGYTIHKFMDETLTYPYQGAQPYVFLRIGEVYLNYAEALYFLGDEVNARYYLNEIRKRARHGDPNILPDVTASGDELFKAIQHERQVELAFEEHRFFDVRRWMIAMDTENKPARGIETWTDLDNGGEVTYKFVELQARKFEKQHYLFPIPNSERQKNDLLEQNPDYSK